MVELSPIYGAPWCSQGIHPLVVYAVAVPLDLRSNCPVMIQTRWFLNSPPGRSAKAYQNRRARNGGPATLIIR